jgi:hypothetical protein
MTNRQKPHHPASVSLGHSLPVGERRLPAIVRRFQHAFEMLALALANLLSPTGRGWPEGPGERAVPIRIRDASGHGAPKWRNFS